MGFTWKTDFPARAPYEYPNQYREDTDFSFVNQRGVVRKEGMLKTAGKAVFVRDVLLPGMLHARVMHSPYARARITSMDSSDAENLPGVRCVIRYDDPYWKDQWICSSEDRHESLALPYSTHFFGEGCGVVVAADTEEIAEEAIRLVAAKTEWEELPFNLYAEPAAEDSAPLSNEERVEASGRETRNLEALLTISRGDIDAGFSEAENTIEFKIRRTEANPHCAEPMTLVAWWNGDILDYWIRDQHNSAIKGYYAGGQTGRTIDFTPLKLDLPMAQIKQHVPYQGSSFGAGSRFSRQYIWHVAELAKRTAKPVRLAFTRHGTEMCCTASEDLDTVYYKVGFMNDGHIVAVQTDCWPENSRQSSGTAFGLQHFIENTSVPNLDGTAHCIEVNRHRTGSVRCEQKINSFSMAQVFGRVAAALDMEVPDVALLNDGFEGQDWDWLKNVQVEHGFSDRHSLQEVIDTGKAAIGWDAKYHAPGAKQLPNGRYHGIGMMWTHEWNSRRGNGNAGVEVNYDGSVSLYGTRVDNGLNAESTYCMIVADILGCDYENMGYRQTEETGYYPMTPDGSCNLCSNGHMFIKAALDCKRVLLECATGTGEYAEWFGPGARRPVTMPFAGLTPDELDTKLGEIFEKANPENKVPFTDVAGRLGVHHKSAPVILGHAYHNQTANRLFGSYDEDDPDNEPGSPEQCRQAYFMEVEVDKETGECIITNAVAAVDAGLMMCPEAFEGQCYGGYIPAIGENRSEQTIYDKLTGVNLNANSLDYKIPVIGDIGTVEATPVETQLGYGPWGATGVGEDPADAPCTVMGVAIYNAIGIWMDEYPITPDRILKALGKG